MWFKQDAKEKHDGGGFTNHKEKTLRVFPGRAKILQQITQRVALSVKCNECLDLTAHQESFNDSTNISISLVIVLLLFFLY